MANPPPPLARQMVRVFPPLPPTAKSATVIPAAAVQSAEAKARADEAANLPKPLLPADQRTAWITDWNVMAACMVSHGVTGFPNAPPSFGDGSTAPPLIGGASGSTLDPTTTAYQTAQAACPFPTNGLNMSELAEANAVWNAQHPATSTGKPTDPAISAGQSTTIQNQTNNASQQQSAP